MAVQVNGQIVVAADISPSHFEPVQEIALYRLNADGSIDTTFGTDGVTSFNFDLYSSQMTIPLDSFDSSLAIASDGKIVVGGVGEDYFHSYLPAMARFNSDGTPDLTFGPDGRVVLFFDGASSPSPGFTPGSIGVVGLVIRADGSIDFDTTVVPYSNVNGGEIAVGQLTPNGSFDSAFGTHGQILLTNSRSDYAGSLAAQADGKLIVAGANYYFDGFSMLLTTSFDVDRLNADGTLDTTFGTMGKTTPESFVGSGWQMFGNTFQTEVDSILIRPDGTILLGGEGGRNDIDGLKAELIALNADGSPDLEFGIGGQALLPESYNFGARWSIYGLALQSDGKILAATARRRGPAPRVRLVQRLR